MIFYIADGDSQRSRYVRAESMEDAMEVWEDAYNPYGYEVIGHPWLCREDCRLVVNEDEAFDIMEES